MKLASLKHSYKDMVSPPDADQDEYYPSICLDEDSMKAMGIKIMPVGTEMKFVANVRVSSVSDSKNGMSSISLEFIEAAVEPKDKQADAATVLFPNG